MRPIDADALIEDIYVQSDDDGWFVVTAQDLEELVNGQPTIEAVPVRHGKWAIEYGSDFKTYKVSRCSECGFEYGTVANQFKFCPNCGSKMEGAES